MATEMDGALLVAHGSRDPAWSQPFEAVAQLLKAGRPGLAVELGFVEIQHRNLNPVSALHSLIPGESHRRFCATERPRLMSEPIAQGILRETGHVANAQRHE